MKRKISAILAADIVKYSKLVAENEEETVGRLAAYRAVFEETTARHGGRIVNMVGDAVLAEFPSSVDAVRCAIGMQDTARQRNQPFPGRHMLIRIGVTLADIMDDAGELFGDGVNIAARLESLAPPGGICVSQTVREQVAGKLAVTLDDIGQQRVKNLPEPIRAYVIPPHPDDGGTTSWRRPPARRARLLAAAAVLVAAGGAAIVAAVQFGGLGQALRGTSETTLASQGGAGQMAARFDGAKVRALATSQSIPLPRTLRVLVPAANVPARVADYLGAWGGDRRWNDRGRQAILVVESVDDGGLALGYYAQGLPQVTTTATQNSARYTPFAATITESGLHFMWGQAKYIFTRMPDGAMLGQLDSTNEKGHFDLTITLNRIE